jgi:hypothetical protein
MRSSKKLATAGASKRPDLQKHPEYGSFITCFHAVPVSLKWPFWFFFSSAS